MTPASDACHAGSEEMSYRRGDATALGRHMFRRFDGDMSEAPLIDVDRLNVGYGEFHAVKDFSFRVERGELYALLGANGAGKTSTLEVIEGHGAASSGSVRVLGTHPTNRCEVRPRVGIMLQESGLSADLTVAESIRLLGRLSWREDVVERVLRIVERVRKADARDSPLSGGEKRQLDFATVFGRPG